MAKEELEKYAHENRKRLDAQEVKIGDVVKVLRGQFAGETGVVVGIIACFGDYTDPYYEVNMDCEVPDKYKCRKNTLAQPNNVIGGLSAYEFEVIGNRAPMQSNEEIKVGDKVRVSKDAPKLLFTRSVCNYPEYVFEVRAIEDDLADIYYGAGKIPIAAFVIPTKYLTKVEDEAKEPKFKAGEIVRYRYDSNLYIVECKTGKYYYALRQVGGDVMMHDVLESDLKLVTEPKQEIKVGDVIDTPEGKGTVRISYDGYWVVQLDNGVWYIHTETNMPSAPYTEPKEQTEAEETDTDNLKKIAEEWANNVSNAIEEYGDAMCKIYVEAHNEAYWDAYAADLAKEIAVKLSKPNENKPGYVAEYAVSVAKALVENLKKK